jgi:peptide/nickel transport system substrate-binding protein
MLFGCAVPDTRPTARQADAGSAQPVAAPKRIVAAIQSDPPSLSSAMNSARTGRARGGPELEMMIHAGLTQEDLPGRRRPQLAEQVPTLENGLWRVFDDGRMETTWRIRPNARWHDGAPFTAEDLLFTVQVGHDRDLAFLANANAEFVESVVAPDHQTVTVTWRKPFILADGMFAYDVALPLPRHLLERPLLEDKASFVDLPYWSTDFVGTGAYRLREFARGSHLLLEANEQYVLGRPKIDTIEVRFIPDLNTLVANVLAGELDLTIGRALSVEHVQMLRERWSGGVVEFETGLSWTGLVPQHLNPTPAVLGNVQFRRALLHALDRQQLVDTLLYGFAPVAHSVIGPAVPEYADLQSSIVRYEYDPRRSTQLIEGLGYAKGTDGLYRDNAGQVLSVEVQSTGGDGYRDAMLFAITDSWRQIGVNGDPVIIPRQRATDREYRMGRPAFELNGRATELIGLLRMHSREIPTPQNGFTGQNRTRYGNAEFDTLLDQFSVTISRTERTAIAGQLVRHITERLVVLDLYYTTDAFAFSKRMRNVPPGNPWNSEEWDVQA